MLRVVSLALVLIALALPAAAAQRLALVIGNDGYDEVPALLKAVSDAEAVSGTLDDQGFEVITVLDAPRREMNRRISEFTGRLQPGDTALVFFAGHGVEIDGENYLLPTDIVAPTSGDRDFIKGESIALSRLLDRVRATGARTTIAIIDACRDNPFEASTGRSIGGTRGLGRIAAPEGTFVMFSAGAGQLALDRLSDADTDANSVFTRALLPRLRQPGLELRDLVSDLRVEVRDLARTQNHAQFPAYYDELLGSFYFNPARSAPEEAVPEAPAPTPAPAPQSSIRADFELARGLGTVAAYEAFLARYADQSDDFTVLLAQSLLDELKGTEEVAALPPQTPETPAPAPEAAPDPRAIMRETQAALNALGCSAGGADGVAGPRTRAAFARFLGAQSGTDLTADAIGSPAALAALTAEGVKRCPVVAAAPAPSGPTITGTWSYSAKCPLFIRVNGTIRLTQRGSGVFIGPIRDSLGQSGTTTARLNGLSITASNDWGNVTETWRATLTPDGRGYSGSSSSGCTFTASLN